jgi:hypothetical protein
MMWHAMCQQHVKLVINLMTHDINFNKITFINQSKLFIMSEHVFYDLSYATINSNMIKDMPKNVFNN